MYSVALKLKKGSNSFNSNPYSTGWDLIANDAENAKIKTPIMIIWFNLKLKLPDWNKTVLEFNIENII